MAAIFKLFFILYTFLFSINSMANSCLSLLEGSNNIKAIQILNNELNNNYQFETWTRELLGSGEIQIEWSKAEGVKIKGTTTRPIIDRFARLTILPPLPNSFHAYDITIELDPRKWKKMNKKQKHLYIIFSLTRALNKLISRHNPFYLPQKSARLKRELKHFAKQMVEQVLEKSFYGHNKLVHNKNPGLAFFENSAMFLGQMFTATTLPFLFVSANSGPMANLSVLQVEKDLKEQYQYDEFQLHHWTSFTLEIVKSAMMGLFITSTVFDIDNNWNLRTQFDLVKTTIDFLFSTNTSEVLSFISESAKNYADERLNLSFIDLEKDSLDLPDIEF